MATEVNVNAARKYTVHIGPGLINSVGAMLLAVHKSCAAVIVADGNVAPFYSGRVADSLRAAGFDTLEYTFPAGEASKNKDVLFDLLEFMAEKGVTRGDMIVALGGGVTGDLAGFAAAVYQRGIEFCQIPTTVLAAVDSSVGGKTAVDLIGGKNMAGAFWQPSLVVCDVDAFNTLPAPVMADGIAEAIKYGVIRDESLFSRFEGRGFFDDVQTAVARCVQIKADIVERDEFDLGLRALLNFGHTPGHAIEKLSGYSVPHGSAVAMGMAIMTRAAVKAGMCEAGADERLIAALNSYGLPTACKFSANELAAAASSDKKRRRKDIDLVLPERIGKCVIKATPVDGLEELFALGLEG